MYFHSCNYLNINYTIFKFFLLFIYITELSRFLHLLLFFI